MTVSADVAGKHPRVDYAAARPHAEWQAPTPAR